MPYRIVIHHSAGMAGFRAIRKHHIEGNGWDEIGYNIVINRDGEVKLGRPIGVQPAANSGKNKKTIAICLIGDNTQDGHRWTGTQEYALTDVVVGLRLIFGHIEVVGHAEHKPGHTQCPGISAEALALIVGE